MAKVVLEYDTSTKEGKLTMGGEEVKNLRYFDFYVNYDDEEKFRMNFATMDKSKSDDGYLYQTIVTASESEDGILAKRVGAVAHEKYSDFVTKKEPLDINLAPLFSHRRRR